VWAVLNLYRSSSFKGCLSAGWRSSIFGERTCVGPEPEFSFPFSLIRVPIKIFISAYGRREPPPPIPLVPLLLSFAYVTFWQLISPLPRPFPAFDVASFHPVLFPNLPQYLLILSPPASCLQWSAAKLKSGMCFFFLLVPSCPSPSCFLLFPSFKVKVRSRDVVTQHKYNNKSITDSFLPRKLAFAVVTKKEEEIKTTGCTNKNKRAFRFFFVSLTIFPHFNLGHLSFLF